MFTLKIKYKTTNGKPLEVIKKGEWIDLQSSQEVNLTNPTSTRLKEVNKVKVRNVHFIPKMIDLGIAMQLPEGYEALVAPRSSSFKNWGFIQTNSTGIIDSSYCGNSDIWKLPVLPFRNATIAEGDRVCQFRIQLSQKATFKQKLKWLLTSKIEFVQVDTLQGKDRGGFGSTGK